MSDLAKDDIHITSGKTKLYFYEPVAVARDMKQVVIRGYIDATGVSHQSVGTPGITRENIGSLRPQRGRSLGREWGSRASSRPRSLVIPSSSLSANSNPSSSNRDASGGVPDASVSSWVTVVVNRSFYLHRPFNALYESMRDHAHSRADRAVACPQTVQKALGARNPGPRRSNNAATTPY